MRSKEHLTDSASVQPMQLARFSRLRIWLRPARRWDDWTQPAHVRWSTSACKTCFCCTLCEKKTTHSE